MDRFKAKTIREKSFEFNEARQVGRKPRTRNTRAKLKVEERKELLEYFQFKK
jgi:hypothetical protein